MKDTPTSSMVKSYIQIANGRRIASLQYHTLSILIPNWQRQVCRTPWIKQQNKSGPCLYCLYCSTAVKIEIINYLHSSSCICYEIKHVSDSGWTLVCDLVMVLEVHCGKTVVLFFVISSVIRSDAFTTTPVPYIEVSHHVGFSHYVVPRWELRV